MAANANGPRLRADTLGDMFEVIEDGDSALYPTTQYTYTDNYQASGLSLSLLHRGI